MAVSARQIRGKRTNPAAQLPQMLKTQKICYTMRVVL